MPPLAMVLHQLAKTVTPFVYFLHRFRVFLTPLVDFLRRSWILFCSFHKPGTF